MVSGRSRGEFHAGVAQHQNPLTVAGDAGFAALEPWELRHDLSLEPLVYGDHVIVINADKVVLTSSKAETKKVYRHSGYPGGLKTATYADLLRTKPEDAVRRTIRGMVPKNRLGRQMLTKLKVYAGPTHQHAAQSPQPYAIEHALAAKA